MKIDAFRFQHTTDAVPDGGEVIAMDTLPSGRTVTVALTRSERVIWARWHPTRPLVPPRDDKDRLDLAHWNECTVKHVQELLVRRLGGEGPVAVVTMPGAAEDNEANERLRRRIERK